MNKFVIRSMSTTDYVVGSLDKVVPYHIYLQKNRARAWWSRSILDAQTFDTEAEAVEFRDARFPDKREQVVPYDASGLPAFWEKN